WAIFSLYIWGTSKIFLNIMCNYLLILITLYKAAINNCLLSCKQQCNRERH
ncbi:hypothetical protein EV356DRAFT_416520, partial [Viridothelium virens]